MIVEDELRLFVTNQSIAPIYRDADFAVGDRRSSNSFPGLLPDQRRKISVAGVGAVDTSEIKIRCDVILPTQEIQFEANVN